MSGSNKAIEEEEEEVSACSQLLFEPHLTKQEFQNTKSLVENFENGIGKRLQEKLLEKAANKKNWLEKMWEDIGYLSLRIPMSYLNMCGILIMDDESWPLDQDGTEVSRAAQISHKSLEYFKFIEHERIKPQRHGKTLFSMYQWKRVYNTTRIPGDKMDSLKIHFKTAEEGGDNPRHVLVFMKGHIFSFDAVDEDGRILTVAELESQLKEVKSKCEDLPVGPGISALTSDCRQSWSKNRQYLIKIHPKNEYLLDHVEKAIFCINFDENKVKKSEVLHNTVFGDCHNRWYDKSVNINAFKGGAVTCHADHTPADGMVMIAVMQYIHASITETQKQGKLDNSYVIRPTAKPVKIDFKVDDYIRKSIDQATAAHNERASEIEFANKHFLDYGKGFMKQQKMHPDTFIQLVIQLAYYRMHSKFAPTYETASTRKYYHGRTETLRSCTMECVQWIKAMDDDNISRDEKIKLLKKAYEKHNQLMADGMKGEGCDRHLFGLYQVAKEEGLEIPEIYKDPAWQKSGGDGNFILSTSLSGYSHLGGGTIPMCHNGYGLFYSILENKTSFCISAFIANKETNAERYYQYICESLKEIRELLCSANL
ncbi:Peroxisomal carnitine O-octanoyltransferase [Nymphon striatum]|nr:Peroxisomal carnitine O-octanoyltransferase [Nymphon striatum]